MCSRSTGLETSALINGHIHDHCPGRHGRNTLFVEHDWSQCPRNEYCSNDQVRDGNQSSDGFGTERNGIDAVPKDVIQVCQAPLIDIHYVDFCPKANGDFGRIGSNHPTTNDCYLAPSHAGHATQEYSPSTT